MKSFLAYGLVALMLSAGGSAHAQASSDQAETTEAVRLNSFPQEQFERDVRCCIALGVGALVVGGLGFAVWRQRRARRPKDPGSPE